MRRKMVFIAMPISQENHDLWEFGILETVISLGWDCVRADQMVEPGPIVDQIYDLIARADIIIGEMTGRNPNVFYEIGFAHAIGKPTLLLAKSEEDLKAFDTKGFRHFLHNGKISQVRKILKDVLPNIALSTEVWPDIPNGKIIYEWPSSSYESPDFKWRSLSLEKDSQVDINGGQCIKTLNHVGTIISVSNTDEYWNWNPKYSIMRLLYKTNRFSVSDFLFLLIEGRGTGAVELKFIGDGDWLDPNNRQEWVTSWPTSELRINETLSWTTWMLKAMVQPTNSNYDPSQRGTTVYLISSVGTATVFYKKIQLIHAVKT